MIQIFHFSMGFMQNFKFYHIYVHVMEVCLFVRKHTKVIAVNEECIKSYAIYLNKLILQAIVVDNHQQQLLNRLIKDRLHFLFRS